MPEFSLVPLGQLAEIRMGQSPDSTYVYEGREQGVPFLQGNAEFGAKHPEAKYSCTQPAKIAEQGSSLISVRAPVGETNIADHLYCIGRGLAAVKFHRYGESLGRELLSFNSKKLDKVSQGTTFAAIGGADLRTLLVADIPDQEAKALERILDTLYTQVQKTEALIAKLEKVKGGLLHDLLTRGVDENGRLRPSPEQAPELYKESPLGLIPREWEISPLKDFSGDQKDSFVNGPFGSDLLTSELRDEGVPVVYVKDIKPGTLRRVSSSHVTETKANELSVCNVFLGDVVIAKVGDPPGIAAPYRENFRSIVTQDVIRIRPAKNIDFEFLAGLLNSHFAKAGVRKIVIEGTRARVSLTDYKNLLLPKPILREQKMIAKKISSFECSVSLEYDRLHTLILTKSGLMEDLLTGRIRVTPLLEQAQATTPA